MFVTRKHLPRRTMLRGVGATLAIGVHHAKVELRVRIPLLRGLAIPRHRFHVILRDTLPVGIRIPAEVLEDLAGVL